MTYFNLRKHAAEEEPEEAEEQAPATEDEAQEPQPEEQAAREYGPLLTGLFGPGRWIAARLGSGWAVGVHVVSAWAVAFYGGWPAASIVAAWVFAVLLFVPREHLEKLAARVEGSSPEEDQEAGEEHPGEPLAAVLWHLIGDAPGTHLKTVAEHLHAAAPEQSVDRAAVRAKLGVLGIPVRASVRDAAGRVNEGVYRADLQAWEETLSPTETAAPSDARSGPCSDALTSDVATAPTGVATPLPWLRRLLSRGGA